MAPEGHLNARLHPQTDGTAAWRSTESNVLSASLARATVPWVPLLELRSAPPEAVLTSFKDMLTSFLAILSHVDPYPKLESRASRAPLGRNRLGAGCIMGKEHKENSGDRTPGFSNRAWLQIVDFR